MAADAVALDLFALPIVLAVLPHHLPAKSQVPA